jgi:hypothetical protein
MAALPYVTATGNIEKALKGIKAAATPESVSQDFVKTILGIKGGSGNQITAYLKKIGFATPDGTPTDLYKKFRNSATEGWAAAQALKTGYAPLYVRNEYMHKLPDDDLKGLIVEETTQRLGLNLGYTINLNLPATSDPAVFNAIFRALKEHLLKGSNE